jgi:glucans biosynthesis protein
MPGRPPGGYVVSTRSGVVLEHPERRRFVLDFAGIEPRPGRDIRVEATAGRGATIVPSPGIRWIEPLKVWRVAIELVADGSHTPVELRCFLREGDDVLTETWSNLWNP